jgi:hypothetical protein
MVSARSLETMPPQGNGIQGPVAIECDPDVRVAHASLDSNANMRSMSAGASPRVRFWRAIKRRSLSQAEIAARELGRLRTEDALALTMLMLHKRDARAERAATRWLGRLIATEPTIGLELTAELADALQDLTGASPDVARARIAVLLRSVGKVESAQVLERW